MADIEQLKNLPHPDNSWTPLRGDLVIIEPTNISPDPQESGDWKLFNVYVIIKGEPFQGWQRGLSDSIELSGDTILTDIKGNNLIYYWNPNGKVEVSGGMTVRIKAIDECDNPTAKLLDLQIKLEKLKKEAEELSLSTNNQITEVFNE